MAFIWHLLTLSVTSRRWPQTDPRTREPSFPWGNQHDNGDIPTGAPAAIWPLACIFLVTVFIQAAFIGRSWYAPDDGAYAWVAAQVVDGAVLNRDIHDVHAGYIHFLNAGALTAFGDSLVSLRYPLALAAAMSAVSAWLLLLPLGVVPALTGSLAAACLSTIQFPNPTPHWYCVPLFLALLLCLRAPLTRRSLLIAGVLLGLTFCLRQLTGAVAAIAALLIVVDQTPHEKSGSSLPVRVLLLGVFALLATYVAKRTDVFSFLIFSAPALMFLMLVSAPAAAGLRMLVDRGGWMLLGMLAAISPLVGYHLWQGSLSVWFDHTVWRALSLSGQEFIQDARYLSIVLDSLGTVFTAQSAPMAVSALMWMALVGMPGVLGVGCIALLRNPSENRARLHICAGASVYTLVAVHYQIPVYLWYAIAVSVVGLAALAAPSKYGRWVLLTIIAIISGVAMYGQAAQPLERGLQGIIAGSREHTWVDCNLPRLGLRIPRRDCEMYRELLRRVDALAGKHDAIFALPSDAQIYYLSARRNPLPFFNSALGIHSPGELQSVIDSLQKQAPAVVIWRDADKYETAEARQVLAYVERTYAPDCKIGPFRLFARTFAVAAQP